MKKEIITRRLKLLPSVDERDRDNYIMHLKDEDIFFYQYGQVYSPELEEAIDFHSSGVIYYTVFLKDTDTMIGYVGIFPETDFNGDSYGDLEFYFFPEYRRRGYAVEAVTAYMDCFCAGDLTGKRETQIYAETIYENTASRNLLVKMGFQKEAVGLKGLVDGDNFRSYGVACYRLELPNNEERSA
jgi:RimJ/RimL family protein N-acetyltransferase